MIGVCGAIGGNDAGQECVTNPVVRIVGVSSAATAALLVYSGDIGNDVWTGTICISPIRITPMKMYTCDLQQTQPERAVVVGDGSWIGRHGDSAGARTASMRHRSQFSGDWRDSDYSVAVGPGEGHQAVCGGRWLESDPEFAGKNSRTKRGTRSHRKINRRFAGVKVVVGGKCGQFFTHWQLVRETQRMAYCTLS